MQVIDYSPFIVVKMPLIGGLLGSQTAVVSTAIRRVIVRRELPSLSPGRIPLFLVIFCYWVDVVLIVLDVGGSVLMRCEGQTPLKVG